MPVIRKSLTLGSLSAFLLVAGIFTLACFKCFKREIAEILFLIIILLGFSLCVGSVCVALYKENRAKRSLFFAGDNNNNSDLYLQTLSLCNRSTDNQSTQNQNGRNRDRNRFIPVSAGHTASPVAAQQSEISFSHTQSREMGSIEETSNGINSTSCVLFSGDTSAILGLHTRGEVIRSLAYRAQVPFITSSGVHQPSITSPPSTPPPSYRSGDSSQRSTPPPSYQEVMERKYSEPPPAYQQTVLDLQQFSSSRTCESNVSQ